MFCLLFRFCFAFHSWRQRVKELSSRVRELEEREQAESLTESDKDSVIHQPPKQVRTYVSDVTLISNTVTFIGGRQNSYFSIGLDRLTDYGFATSVVT